MLIQRRQTPDLNKHRMRREIEDIVDGMTYLEMGNSLRKNQPAFWLGNRPP
jgi:hypothetical protein